MKLNSNSLGKSPKPTHLIFDFDGTLADSLVIAVTAYNEVSQTPWLFGRLKQVDLNDLSKLKEYSYQKLLNEFKIPKWFLPILFALVMKKYANLAKQVQPVAQILPILNKLQEAGYTLHLVTSNNLHNVEVFTQKYRLPKFGIIETKVPMFSKGKVLKKVMNELGLSSEMAIYIGDEVRDIQAGKQVGIRTMAVSWGFSGKGQLKNAKPDWIVDNPTDMIKILS